jgi:hypothetical protein
VSDRSQRKIIAFNFTFFDFSYFNIQQHISAKLPIQSKKFFVSTTIPSIGAVQLEMARNGGKSVLSLASSTNLQCRRTLH